MTIDPVTWLTKVAGKLAGPPLVVIAIAAVLFGLGWLIWQDGYDARDQEARTEQLELRIDRLQYLADMATFSANLSGEYVLRRGQAEVIYRTIRQEIPRVVTVFKTAPGAPAQPLPRCVFTTGFVSLWNHALSGTEPANAAAAGAAGAVAATDSAGDEALLDSGLDQRAILDNHVANGEVSAEVRRRCELLQDFYNRAPGGTDDR